MGMKKKRLIYVRKYGRKFAAWIGKCKKIVAEKVSPASVETEEVEKVEEQPETEKAPTEEKSEETSDI